MKKLLKLGMVIFVLTVMLLMKPDKASAAEYSGLNYQFLYNPEYYYQNNPDVAQLYGYHTTVLYRHFIQYGMSEGRVASENFDVQVYKACNYDLVLAFGDNNAAYYTHYLRYGLNENRKITGYAYNGLEYSAVFDPEYYYDHNSDVAAVFGSDSKILWKHFMQYGMSEGRRASANFDVQIYKAYNLDLRRAFGDNMAAYYSHYIAFGKKENRTATSADILYNGVIYTDVYNKDYYIANNPDVAAAFGGDEQATFQHFIKYGMAEGRKAEGSFDVWQYKNNYKDLQDAYGDDMKAYYMHYIDYGKAEGRNSSKHVHTYKVIGHKDATCTEGGYTTYTCDCGNTYNEPTPALGHDWKLISGDGVSVKTLVYRCDRCGEQYTAANPKYVSPGIACWGDSMTLGQYGNGTTYPNTLESLTGIPTYNLGVSGETSIQIVTREGGFTMVTGNDIHLDKGGTAEIELLSTYTGDDVSIDPNHNGVGDYSGYNFATYFDNMCYINGQAYEIQYDGENHYITDSYKADSDSSSIDIPAGTQVLSKASVDRAKDILVLEIGSNGGWNDDYQTLIDQYRAMLLSVGCQNYIILGDSDDPGDSADGSQEEFDYGNGLDETGWESALHDAFGDHFLNVRTYLIQNGLSDNDLSATEEDEERAAYGKISLQLRTDYDNTHLCSAGYYSKGIAVYQKGKTLGYW